MAEDDTGKEDGAPQKSDEPPELEMEGADADWACEEESAKESAEFKVQSMRSRVSRAELLEDASDATSCDYLEELDAQGNCAEDKRADEAAREDEATGSGQLPVHGKGGMEARPRLASRAASSAASRGPSSGSDRSDGCDSDKGNGRVHSRSRSSTLSSCEGSGEASGEVGTFMADVQRRRDAYMRSPEAQQAFAKMAGGMADIMCRHLPRG